jgi:hypothetical protein
LINKYTDTVNKLNELINTYTELKDNTINEDNENIRR